ncbi:MAG: efflux RND transporter permease subunit, partial [Planctomycetota bacterium]|nr:efflux RND transporter permease subunit [Planctomycetota bacterium]
TLAALSVVPWLAWVLLKKIGDKDQGMAKKAKPTSPFLKELYRVVVSPWIATRKRAWTLLGVVCLLFAGSMSLAALGKVPLKLLPYDNKDEFQIMLDMPEGTTLEHTDSVTRKFEAYLSKQPEVVNWQAFVGAASPMDFNGLVRHTYLRNSSELADIRITLLPKSVREMQSHAITLRMRNDLEKIAQSEGVVMRIVEVPPGPPVLATVTAEVYGSEGGRYQEIIDDARVLTERMSSEPGLVDLDILASEEHSRIHYSLDREQASIHGVEEKQTSRILSTALQGAQPGILRIPGERQVLPVKVRLPRDQRSDISALGGIAVRSSEGSLIALDEIGTFEVVSEDPVIYHKNLRPVVFVTGEMAGRPPAEAIFELQSWLKENPLPNTSTVEWAGEGEWEVTVRVFRDLGLAFGAAMVLIYLLLVIEIGSMILPLLVMMAIPLTAIGIMPGFWLLNVFFAEEVGGFQNGIYFTATAMIGMIALGGIVVRNSLVLMGFIGEARAKGASLREAIFESGAARIRPILLTAGTTALGAWPITLDPIFSGLAWSLIFGLIASTLFSLVVVPSTFFLLEERREKANQ